MEYRINLTDDTVEKLGTALGEPIQELEQEILEKEQEIAEKEQEIEELQQEIAEFPTIESKSITANGTYSEEGKAYSPVVVNVPQTTVVPLNVTQNGTYSEQGKAYSPVTVNVPEGIAKNNYRVTLNNMSGEALDVAFNQILSGYQGVTPVIFTITAGNNITITPILTDGIISDSSLIPICAIKGRYTNVSGVVSPTAVYDSNGYTIIFIRNYSTMFDTYVNIQANT